MAQVGAAMVISIVIAALLIDLLGSRARREVCCQLRRELSHGWEGVPEVSSTSSECQGRRTCRRPWNVIPTSS